MCDQVVRQVRMASENGQLVKALTGIRDIIKFGPMVDQQFGAFNVMVVDR